MWESGNSREWKLYIYILFLNRNQQTSSNVLGGQESRTKVEPAFQARDREGRQADSSAEFGVGLGHWLDAWAVLQLHGETFSLSKEQFTQVSFFRGMGWFSKTVNLAVLSSQLSDWGTNRGKSCQASLHCTWPRAETIKRRPKPHRGIYLRWSGRGACPQIMVLAIQASGLLPAAKIICNAAARRGGAPALIITKSCH